MGMLCDLVPFILVFDLVFVTTDPGSARVSCILLIEVAQDSIHINPYWCIHNIGRGTEIRTRTNGFGDRLAWTFHYAPSHLFIFGSHEEIRTLTVLLLRQLPLPIGLRCLG